MRDRLIELIKQGNGGYDFMSLERIADYLLANGVIVPPCKVGQTVYFKNEYFNTIVSGEAEHIRISRNGITVHTADNHHLWADEVFLTREEAEAKLKESSNDC